MKKKELNHWIYLFIKAWCLGYQSATRASQMLSRHLSTLKKRFLQELSENFQVSRTYESVSSKLFVNMEERAERLFWNFGANPDPALNKRCENEVSFCCSGSRIRIPTVLNSVASDKTTFMFFSIVKGEYNAWIEKTLKKITLPDSVFGCRQSKKLDRRENYEALNWKHGYYVWPCILILSFYWMPFFTIKFSRFQSLSKRLGLIREQYLSDIGSSGSLVT